MPARNKKHSPTSYSPSMRTIPDDHLHPATSPPPALPAVTVFTPPLLPHHHHPRVSIITNTSSKPQSSSSPSCTFKTLFLFPPCRLLSSAHRTICNITATLLLRNQDLHPTLPVTTILTPYPLAAGTSRSPRCPMHYHLYLSLTKIIKPTGP